VLRSPWDYCERREEFLAWADELPRLANPAAVLRLNTDKHYLGALADAGVPTVATTYLAPGSALPDLAGEVVLKPTISAGGRDTGRFAPADRAAAEALLARLHAQGRAAMLQPYLAAVDTNGETGLFLFGGSFSHAIRKGPILRPGEVAPLGEEAPGLAVAAAMTDPALVAPREPSAAEHALARRVVGTVGRLTGCDLLYARIDLLDDGDGEPVLLEAELTEPSLYLAHAPGAARRFARAVTRELTRPGARA
jgi:hypothetical protein